MTMAAAAIAGRGVAVQASMNRGGHDGQIAPSVVELIPVAVVNVGARRQLAVLLLCRPSVRLNPLASIGILILGVASEIDAGMKVGHCVPRLKGAVTSCHDSRDIHGASTTAKPVAHRQSC